MFRFQIIRMLLIKANSYIMLFVNISCKALKDQGDAKSLKFRGMIHTDSVGASILKQNKETSKGGTKNISKRLQTDNNEFQYIDKLNNEEHQRTTNKCVFIDPDRRDMLICMGEKCESRHDGFIYRYTSNQRAKEINSRKFRKFHQQNKPKIVSDLEKSLTTHSTSTVDFQKYSRYLEARRDASDLLSNYYRCDYLGSLPFRKIKLPSYINRKQSDARLAKTLKRKFGEDCVLVFGNWSASNTKYHEPIRGVGMRRMLKKEGLQLYLFDEYKTSSFCPKCKNGKLKKFPYVKNLRPYIRGKHPVVECHGLLRCTNQKCLVPSRLWNRDLATVLNFRDIVLSHRQVLGRLSRFKRETSKRASTSTAISTSKKICSMPSDDVSSEGGNTNRVNV
ncbi:uncharacterized protein BX663DRAFT_532908 [Cokeromyces recurvatus]|uniref:uncharacterized protein n=1 Tax=Cokeromyces recurvatus TaxID=90255 RepID=UPI002220AA5C|nr:uncharacterized protein BX663DRAFT_532908 [Cokeromyces recurvatus]KAI7899206.1 hypothetical protein BX663DRAFT_532908 [Cokeromyces recurvatus]